MATSDTWEDADALEAMMAALKAPSSSSSSGGGGGATATATAAAPSARGAGDRARDRDAAGAAIAGGAAAASASASASASRPPPSATAPAGSGSFCDPRADAVARARVDPVLRDALAERGAARMIVLKIERTTRRRVLSSHTGPHTTPFGVVNADP